MSSSPQQGLPIVRPRLRRRGRPLGLVGRRSTSLLVLTQNQPPLEWVAFSAPDVCDRHADAQDPVDRDVVLDVGGVRLLVPPALRPGDGRRRRSASTRCCCRWRRRHSLRSDGLQLRQPDALRVGVGHLSFFSAAGVAPLFTQTVADGLRSSCRLCLMAASYFLINSVLAAVGHRLPQPAIADRLLARAFRRADSDLCRGRLGRRCCWSLPFARSTSAPSR